MSESPITPDTKQQSSVALLTKTTHICSMCHGFAWKCIKLLTTTPCGPFCHKLLAPCAVHRGPQARRVARCFQRVLGRKFHEVPVASPTQCTRTTGSRALLPQQRVVRDDDKRTALVTKPAEDLVASRVRPVEGNARRSRVRRRPANTNARAAEKTPPNRQRLSWKPHQR